MKDKLILKINLLEKKELASREEFLIILEDLLKFCQNESDNIEESNWSKIASEIYSQIKQPLNGFNYNLKSNKELNSIIRSIVKSFS